MSEAYQILWSAAAENDLRRIVEYVAADSPSNALNILRKIRQTALSLYNFPERGRIVPELQNQGIFIYRELIASPWRIVYRICRHSVHVLSVLDARRNLEDLLLERLV